MTKESGNVSMSINRLLLVIAMVGSLAFAVTACGDDEEDGGGTASGSTTEETTEELSGSIRIDGSSTVFPFAQAAAELFNEEQPNVQIAVGQSGTGGGFEKFCAGETDISDASRPIEDDEVEICEQNSVAYEEIAIANDGISVVTSKELPVDCLTVDQLKQLWEPKSKINNLSEIDPSLPDTELTLFGPGTDSGTFDFFTEAINGEEGATREDYEASEDDNQLVTGVSGSPGGLGYFGFSYYEQNADKLNLVGVGEDAASCQKPSAENIQDGSYVPLGRQIFMYPSAEALGRPEVKAFMDFVIQNEPAIAEAAQIVPLTDEQIGEAQQKVDTLVGGS
jgi:phosphate transport system substrate-binding protein